MARFSETCNGLEIIFSISVACWFANVDNDSKLLLFAWLNIYFFAQVIAIFKFWKPFFSNSYNLGLIKYIGMSDRYQNKLQCTCTIFLSLF